MIILGLDTATPTGSVALSDDGRLLCELTFKAPESYAAVLLPAVETLLGQARIKLKEVEGFAVSLGPGSFTSLRIGLATVKGMARATGRPAVGVPTLDILAWNLPCGGPVICPIIDAKRGEVYACTYRYHPEVGEMERLSPYAVIAPAGVVDLCQGEMILTGDGLDAYEELLEGLLGSRARFAPPSSRYPRAAVMNTLAFERFKRGEVDDLAGLAPIYVRRYRAKEHPGVDKSLSP